MIDEATPRGNELAIIKLEGVINGVVFQQDAFKLNVEELVGIQKETQQQLDAFVIITMNHINSTKILQSALNKALLFLIVGVATYILPKILDVAVPMLKQIILK